MQGRSSSFRFKVVCFGQHTYFPNLPNFPNSLLEWCNAKEGESCVYWEPQMLYSQHAERYMYDMVASPMRPKVDQSGSPYANKSSPQEWEEKTTSLRRRAWTHPARLGEGKARDEGEWWQSMGANLHPTSGTTPAPFAGTSGHCTHFVLNLQKCKQGDAA